MSDGSARPRPIGSPVTRRGALAGGILLLSGCSLRLQAGSHLPGPTATAPTDIAPLREVGTRLSELVTVTGTSGQHTAQARAISALHRQQLQHLDATLKGLGAPASATVPAPASSTQASTPSTSSTTRAGDTSRGKSASPTSPSGRSSSTGGGDWVKTENGWVTPSVLHTFASISSASRPMAMCAAATGLAAAEGAGTAAPWDADATFPAAGAQASLSASAAAIDALAWVAARTDPTKRGSTPDALNWLYAVQSMAQAAAPHQPTATPSPIRRYAGPDAAKKVAVTALQDLLPACAQAAAGASTTPQVRGVLLAWTKTIRELSRLGSPNMSTFPGLTTGS